MDNNRYLTIDGIPVEINGEKNLLALIQKVGIKMPTFCYHSELSTYGACRMCMVEDQWGTLHASCSTPPKPGMEIRTNTERLRKYRKVILELLLANHCRDCTTCDNNEKCKLQDIARRFHIEGVRFPNAASKPDVDDSSPCITIDHHKCILCGDCVRTCEEIQGMNIIDFTHRSADLRVMPAFDQKLAETDCIGCGQCAAVCPTAAITVYNDIGRVWRALHDKNKRVVFQIAPAVRVAIGEAFGLHPGENAMGKMVAALRLMGAAEVFDTSFAADLTTVVEAKEFMDRLKNGGTFPMFTSCCPAWVKYVEYQRPELLRHISSCKSPMEMFAAVLRDHYEKNSDGREVYHVAVMPCTAKKGEAKREEFTHNGKPDVDAVLTTIELINMIKESGIDFANLEDEAVDMPFGITTGSGVIFGATGGVAEAVARCCCPDKTKNAAMAIEYSGLRGVDGVRVASMLVGERTIRIAVCNGLLNAQKLIDEIETGREYFDLIEVMTCRAGCVGGAGQPHGLTKDKYDRAAGLYNADKTALIKRSEQNPVIETLLRDIGEREHELLHVHYKGREF